MPGPNPTCDLVPTPISRSRRPWFSILCGLGLGALLGSSACHGCGGYGPCDREVCVCRDEDDCGFACDYDDCRGTCERLDRCQGACHDGCDLTCRDTSSCDLDCGDACNVTCERVSTCDVGCADDCEIHCSDLSSCDVEMFSGKVFCSRVGSCNVSCVGGDATEPATDCGGGVFACGAC